MSTRGSGGGLSAQQHQSSAVQNFKPKSEWKHEEQASFLLVYLPGFAVDQLTITPDYSNASVRIEGKRRLPNYRMLPVDETFDIPQHLDLSKMDKQFGRGILMLKIPINSDLQSQQQSAVEDTPKFDPETTAMADRASIDEKLVDNGRAAKPERTDEAAKTDEGKSAGNGDRESPETVKNNGDEVKDGGSKEESKESAMDSATKVEERVKGAGKEDRALIVNMGIAVFMLMGLGVSLLYTLGH
ncbi:hypothetical protein HRI_002001200 [Hibiscus trionum]|uniref:SHSP domain-containing protein n=1 Tax=Hibiscus trionum TaxID=183268 RepID=A0A9W7HTJ7_HIBTR|nr:hypothetical protein HRI_002001200 [Hibiscus trionum]